MEELQRFQRKGKKERVRGGGGAVDKDEIRHDDACIACRTLAASSPTS